jgi:hypothetical protein
MKSEKLDQKTRDEQVDILGKIISEGYILDENNILSLSEEKLASNDETKYLLEYTDLLRMAHNAIEIINDDKSFLDEDMYEYLDIL